MSAISKQRDYSSKQVYIELSLFNHHISQIYPKYFDLEFGIKPKWLENTKGATFFKFLILFIDLRKLCETIA